MLPQNFDELPTETITEKSEISDYPLHFSGNLVIERDIEGCDLTARGNVHVHGQTRNCHIHSEQGTVFLLYGAFSGSNITAGRNIYTRHVNKSNLRAKNDVIVESVISGSEIEAGRCIFVERRTAKVIDSVLRAKVGTFLAIVGGPKDVGNIRIHIELEKGFIRFFELHPRTELNIGKYNRISHVTFGQGTAEVKGGAIEVKEAPSQAPKKNVLPAWGRNKNRFTSKPEEEEEVEMEISVTSEASVCIINLKGKLHSFTVDQFDKSCTENVKKGQSLLLDFEELTFISSAGLRSILVLWKSLGKENFAICGMQPFIEEVFKMSGFTTYLNVFETRDEALQVLR